MALVGVAAPPRATAAPVYTAQLELGPELDSNALRASGEGEASVLSPLARLEAGGTLGFAWRGDWSLAYGIGAKLFAEQAARRADEMAHHAQASVVRARAGKAWSLALALYDAFQRGSLRDFRSAALSTSAGLVGQRRLSAWLGLGYHGLSYKPSHDYDFHAATGSLSLQSDLFSGPVDETVHWRLRLAYSAAYRTFAGPQLGLREPCAGVIDTPICNYPKDERRADLNHSLRVSVDYLGNAAAALWYLVEHNQSNSYGESFVRQAVGLKFTARVAAEFYLTAAGTLQVSAFRDPYLVGRLSAQSFVNVEDENRSTLLVQLARDLGRRVTLALRYSVFLSEGQAAAAISAGAGFIRHIVFGGLRVRFGNREL